MRHYLGLALIAEGPTDHQFLRPLLERFTETLCLARARGLVEIPSMIELHSPRRVKDSDRATRILEAARDAWGSFHILFIHSDGGGDPTAAEVNCIDPARRAIRDDVDLGEGSTRTVAIVPVRETEAWMLADGDAIREAFGTTLTNARLGLPSHARAVETIPDPKVELDRILASVLGRASRRRRLQNYLATIGQTARFERLREVPSFQSFEEQFTAALTGLAYLDDAPV